MSTHANVVSCLESTARAVTLLPAFPRRTTRIQMDPGRQSGLWALLATHMLASYLASWRRRWHEEPTQPTVTGDGPPRLAELAGGALSNGGSDVRLESRA